MSNIADGIAYALEQARAARAQEKVAEIQSPEPVSVADGPAPLGARIKEAAKVLLAEDEEDVTVGDLRALMEATG